MFEQWSERRRRWFLLTFCAVSWALFANSLAHLGEDIWRGGIGADGVHAIGILGTLAMWTAVWGAFKLRMRHWAFAALCGITLSSALVESGLRDGAAAAIWSAQCDTGNGPACHQLARYFESGRSPMHGWLDAQPLHERACERGVSASCHTTSTPKRPARRGCLEDRVISDCRTAAVAHAARGELELMYDIEDFACTQLRDVDSCTSLLGSGFHTRRVAACEVLQPYCRTSSALHCSVTLRRCERVSSPHAGTD